MVMLAKIVYWQQFLVTLTQSKLQPFMYEYFENFKDILAHYLMCTFRRPKIIKFGKKQGPIHYTQPIGTHNTPSALSIRPDCDRTWGKRLSKKNLTVKINNTIETANKIDFQISNKPLRCWLLCILILVARCNLRDACRAFLTNFSTINLTEAFVVEFCKEIFRLKELKGLVFSDPVFKAYSLTLF